MTAMSTHVAFLRALNVGGRRLTNEELCSHVESLGFSGVFTYRASGNVVLESENTRENIEVALEKGLSAALGYDVPAMVRSVEDLRSLIGAAPFSEADIIGTGRPQVMFLKVAVPIDVSHFATEVDLLVASHSDLFWLPIDGISNTRLDIRELEKEVGTHTVRTIGTLEGIVKKVGSRG